MGIRWNRGAYECRVYSPASKKLEYVGRRKLERDAKKLFREKTEEFQGAQVSELTVRDYAPEWLELHHGPGTRRPKESTRRLNEGLLRQFVQEFGDRLLDGGVSRREALAWSKPRAHVAKVVSAMYNDALDGEATKANPFANRRLARGRERKDIAPITEQELETLAKVALEHWGPDGYGMVARAWVLFAAWVGCRPGETFTVPLKSLDFQRGLVSVRRVKPPYSVDTVVLAEAASAAVREALPLLSHRGPLFRTVRGMEMGRGLPKHWGPVRDKFQMTVSGERWLELLGGQPFLDFYAMRHFAASIIVARGGNEYDVASQLGNSPEVARETYIHEYRDRQHDRLRGLLDQPAVVDLSAVRDRRGA